MDLKDYMQSRDRRKSAPSWGRLRSELKKKRDGRSSR